MSDYWDEYDESLKAIQSFYGTTSNKSNGAKRSKELELTKPDPQIKKIVAENRERNRAKIQKLAELIKARRNITLAEKRKSRETHLL